VTGNWCLAAIPYFPATFWQRTTCPAGEARCIAAPDCTVSNPVTNPTSACVNAPDGVGKLRRYEIRSGNSFPSGRSYADELQNFANWFTYHRKRKLMLAGAMGRALEPVSGLRLGVVNFCDGSTASTCNAPTMYDADASSSASNRLAAAGRFYLNGMTQKGTPTHYTMSYVAGQFDTNTNVVQYACQRNSMFVVTDGFSNTAALTPPAWDAGKSASTWGAAAPFQTTTTGSLADLALHYYTNRLRSGGTTPLPAGKLPPGDPARTNPDRNTDLHITTYGITLGARGTLFPTFNDPFSVNVFSTAPTWPLPVADDATMIDDLWHATVNGRGRMYQANDSEAMRDSISAAFSDILGQVGAQSALAVTSINLQRGDAQAYLGTYTPAGWAGDLTANPISTTSGGISNTPNWSAAQLLASRDWTTRVIAGYNGSAGVGFTSSAVGSIVNPAGAWGSNDAVVNWLRGSRSGEGTSFRARSSLMGAVINAEPVPSRDDKLVYVASGEGMLHAFDTDTGREHWAFVPGGVLPNLGETSSRSYAFRTRLDATPALGKLASGRRILAGALGSAGRSVYALDVSNPRDMSETALAAAALWQFPAASDTTTQAKMGYSYGRPVIARTATQGDVVLVTSGYDKGQAIGDGKGRLWMLNATTGAVLREFVTTDGAAGAEAGLSHVAGYRETDGSVRHVYGGDLLGNLWHFDLDTGTTVKLAQLRDAAGNAQPVTAPPELVTLAGKRVVLVGTGRLLDITDFGSSRVQSFYAIADGVLLSNARSGLVARTYTRGATSEFSGAAVDWATGRGWYTDLPGGEQANTAPVVAYGSVGFTTNVNGGADCSQSSWMYLLDLGTGLKSSAADFTSALVSNNANTSRLTALRLAGGELVGTTRTSDNGVANRNMSSAVAIQPSKNVWREIRR
jgi:type IV pilus assembly protein PilY1